MKAIFPGSFDPITQGHYALVQSVLPLFDTIYIAIGVNSEKSGFFPLAKRKEWIQHCFAGNDKVQVVEYKSLTVDLCGELGATYILRGIRNMIDFQYENDIAQANRALNPSVETLFLTPAPELAHVSSSFVRELFRYQGDWQRWVPAGVNLFNAIRNDD